MLDKNYAQNSMIGVYSSECSMLTLRNILQVFEYLKRKLTDLGSKYQEKVLETPENKISLAFTLSALRDVGLFSNIIHELKLICMTLRLSHILVAFSKN